MKTKDYSKNINTITIVFSLTNVLIDSGYL